MVQADPKTHTSTQIVCHGLATIEGSVCAHFHSVVLHTLVEVPNLELGCLVKEVRPCRQILIGDSLKLLSFPVVRTKVGEV